MVTDRCTGIFDVLAGTSDGVTTGNRSDESNGSE